MQTRFRVLVQRSDDNNQLEAVYVPSLNFSLNFAKYPEEMKYFEALGQRHYLEKLISSIIKAKQKSFEKIEDSSTMALMTQGYSELNGQTHSYEMYFVKKAKDVKTSIIDGIGIIIAGEGLNKKGFLISNNKFLLRDKKKWSHDFTVTDDENAILQNTTCDANGYPEVTLENCQLINGLKKNILNAAGWVYLGSNSYPLDIYLHDYTRRPCNFFTKTMPYFLRFSMLLRFSVGTLLNLSIVDSMSNPLFPPTCHSVIDSATGNTTETCSPNSYLRPFNIAQTMLGYTMMLFFIFFGARSRTLAGLGVQIDEACIKLYRKFFGPKAPQKPKKSGKKCSWLDCKISLAKGFFFFLILNQMFLHGLWSYLRIKTLTNNIPDTEDSMFSHEFIKNISLTEWVLELLNEPSMILAEAAFISFIVENYFKPTNMLQSISEQANDLNQDDMLRPLLSAQPDVAESKMVAIEIADQPAALFSAKNPRNKRVLAPVTTGTSGLTIVAGTSEKSMCVVM